MIGDDAGDALTLVLRRFTSSSSEGAKAKVRAAPQHAVEAAVAHRPVFPLHQGCVTLTLQHYDPDSLPLPGDDSPEAPPPLQSPLRRLSLER